MKFNTKELNPGTWFYFNEKKPEDGRIKIRVCNTRILAKIRDETISIDAEYRDGKRHEFTRIDHAARDRLIWDYCIVDWENLVDDDEKPIECTTENKILLMNEHIGFAAFVESCFEKLNETSIADEDESEKN